MAILVCDIILRGKSIAELFGGLSYAPPCLSGDLLRALAGLPEVVAWDEPVSRLCCHCLCICIGQPPCRGEEK